MEVFAIVAAMGMETLEVMHVHPKVGGEFHAGCNRQGLMICARVGRRGLGRKYGGPEDSTAFSRRHCQVEVREVRLATSLDV